jgi:hypothetical protein
MDILDFLENMGFGLGTVMVLVIFLFLITSAGTLIPGLLMGFGHLMYLLIIILLVGAAIYFIGRFAKDFVKKMR